MVWAKLLLAVLINVLTTLCVAGRNFTCVQTPCHDPCQCCGDHKQTCCCHEESSSGLPWYVFVIIAVVLVAAVAGGIYCWRRRRTHQQI